jgi:hypothetical protein
MAKASKRSKQLDDIAAQLTKIRSELKKLAARQKTLSKSVRKLISVRSDERKGASKKGGSGSRRRPARVDSKAPKTEPRKRPVLVALDSPMPAKSGA